VRHVCQPRLWRLHSGGLIRSLGTGGRERGRTGPATAVALGELPIVGTVPRMKWDLSDPNFATTLARRRTPVVLTDSPASTAWRGFDRWTEPGYLEQQLTEPLNFAKSYDPNFMYSTSGTAGRRRLGGSRRPLRSGWVRRIQTLSHSSFCLFLGLFVSFFASLSMCACFRCFSVGAAPA